MLRKTVFALAAVASVSLLAPGMAQARGGHGGMGGHGMGGGFHGGFHGGGFHGHGFGVGAAALGLGLGLAYGAYPYGAYDYYDGPYYGGDYYVDDGGCYIVRRHVRTPYGWRIRPVQVCN